ncbi:MAG: alpha amylase C-terminal domain-containing protein [Clostridia bacterium]|nr:alpha amylase C-terminal domain-containing protein [Deltaproteobacteria bacterium]
MLAYRIGDNHVVVGCLKTMREGYDISLPPGKWREVMNGNPIRYDGNDDVNGDAVFVGLARVKLPKHGALVLERVAD